MTVARQFVLTNASRAKTELTARTLTAFSNVSIVLLYTGKDSARRNEVTAALSWQCCTEEIIKSDGDGQKSNLAGGSRHNVTTTYI